MKQIDKPHPEELSFQTKIEAMSAETAAVEAIKDTWLFMTGGEMPEEIFREAKIRNTGNKGAVLWDAKFAVQAANWGLASDLAKLRLKYVFDVPIADIQMDQVGRTGMPESDPFITELIVALGSEILKNAYRCLGEDIDEVIDSMKVKIAQSETPYDAMNVILEVLIPRIDFMREKDEQLKKNEDVLKTPKGRQINHIFKLSPHTIGVAPDNHFVPSCLATSIIVASFLRQCGIQEIFHAGVVRPSQYYYTRVANLHAKHTLERARQQGEVLSDSYTSFYEREIARTNTHLYDYDPHAALLVKIDDKWFIVDPLAYQILVLSDDQGARFTESASVIQQIPALDLVVHPDSKQRDIENAEMAMGTYDILTDNNPSKESWRKALDSAIVYNDPQPFAELFCVRLEGEPFTLKDLLQASGLLRPRVVEILMSELSDEEKELEIDKMTDDIIQWSLSYHVFGLDTVSPDAIRACLERCDRDKRYYQRRLEDLSVWLYKLYGSVLQEYRIYFSENRKYQEPHNALEVGQLEHRIGLCALLDVSYGLGEVLPMSFWGRQSSGQLPWLYFNQSEAYRTASEVEKRVAGQILQMLEVDNSHYSQIAGIMKKA